MGIGELESEIAVIDLEIIKNDSGSIVSLEENSSVPFKIRRVYYLHDLTVGASRGYHAHLKLKQLAICVAGSCSINVEYAAGKRKIELNDPHSALYMNGLVWREIRECSEDCVLMVIADAVYAESDYIRDYQSFKQRLVAKLAV